MRDLPDLANLDCVDRVNRAIDYVTGNLSEPLKLEEVAKVAHFSSYHFHRIFRALVGETLHDFVTRVADRPVTVAVYSEFGRRIAPNASGGTDHGHAGTMLLAGAVQPGHHGEPPPLAALADGDLATTVDYRAVLGGLLEDVVGVDAADILGAGPAPLAVV